MREFDDKIFDLTGKELVTVVCVMSSVIVIVAGLAVLSRYIGTLEIVGAG